MGPMNRIVLFNCDLEPIMLLEARGALHPLALRDLYGAYRVVTTPSGEKLTFEPVSIRVGSSETFALVTTSAHVEKEVRRILDDAVRLAVPGAYHLATTLGFY